MNPEVRQPRPFSDRAVWPVSYQPAHHPHRGLGRPVTAVAKQRAPRDPWHRASTRQGACTH